MIIHCIYVALVVLLSNEYAMICCGKNAYFSKVYRFISNYSTKVPRPIREFNVDELEYKGEPISFACVYDER